MAMPPDYPQVVLTPDGFTLLEASGRATVQLRWADLDEITAWKQDFVTWDEVLLTFTCRSADHVVHVGEEFPGFWSLSAEVRRHFPTIPQDWYDRVVRPPFATNTAVLYSARTEEPPALGS